MEWLVDIFTSGGLGAITGLAGGLLTKHIERKDKANERGFLLKKQELSIEELKLEQVHEVGMANKQIERSQVEGSIKIEHAEVGAFAESQKTTGKLTGFLRAVRPAITFYLLLVSTILTVIVWGRVGGLSSFTPDQLTDLLREMIGTILFLTVTAVAWWFGSRGGNIK
jgi:uncharacterized membrane protein